MIPALYIHIPFCTKRCHYCDFFSVKTSLFNNPDEQYLDFTTALIEEIKLYQYQFKDNIFQSIFIGGGTPSLLEPKHFNLIFAQLFKSFQFQKDFEFTIECNPESINYDKLSCYKEWGVNRISLGCQTFHDPILSDLGRNTTKKEILEKYSLIRSLGFENVNLDLIFGLVNQSTEQYISDLKQAVQLEPDHLSCYSLTLSRKILNNKISAGTLVLPDEDSVSNEYLYTYDYLAENLLHFYEVSNFALEGKESQHNLFYWTGKNYLGIGPSACGTINNSRYINAQNLKHYITKLRQSILPVESRELLTKETLRNEKIMLSLRTKKGLDIESLKAFQNDDEDSEKWIYSFEKKIEDYKSMKLLIQKGNRVFPSRKGILLLDTLISNLF